MIRIRHRILLSGLKIFDQLIMAIALAAAIWCCSPTFQAVPIAEFLSLKIKAQNFFFFICFLIVWYLLFSRLVRYDYSRRLSTRLSEIRDILKATSLGTFALWISAFVFRLEDVDTQFLLIFWITGTMIAVASRIAIRYALSRIRLSGRDLRHILFVGTNTRAVQFARLIESKRELGYVVVGFADNDWPGLSEFTQSGYRLLVTIDGLADYIKAHVIDEIMLCLPIKSFFDETSDIMAWCDEQGIIVRLIPTVFNFSLSSSRIEQFEGEQVITYFRETLYWQVFLKHLMDYAVASVLLLALLPLFLIVAALIKSSSQGPVFFAQERVGMNKRRFRLYKFRTMVADAEEKLDDVRHLNEASGPVFKIRDDPRLTPVGKLLRCTSIDELPQLLNILKGDMSLVGPRPSIPSEVEQYGGKDRKRLSMRPGITCLWQVSGRSDVSFERWMELDRQYIDNWSLWLDLKVHQISSC